MGRPKDHKYRPRKRTKRSKLSKLLALLRQQKKNAENGKKQAQEGAQGEGLLQPASEDEKNLPSTSTSEELSAMAKDSQVLNRHVEGDTQNKAMQPSINDDPTQVQGSLNSTNSQIGIKNSTVEKATLKRKPIDLSALYSCKVRGRRIIDLEYFFKIIKELNYHSDSDCNLNDMYIIKEQRMGLLLKFEVKCATCKFKREVWSEDPQSKSNINTDAVEGILSISGGFEDLRQFLKALKVPQLAKSIFQEEYKKIIKDFKNDVQQLFQEITEPASVAATEQSSRNTDSTLNSSLPEKEKIIVLDDLADILIGNEIEEVKRDNADSPNKHETALEMDVDVQNMNAEKDIQVSPNSEDVLKAVSLDENMEIPVAKRKRIVDKDCLNVSGVIIKQEIEVEEEMPVGSCENVTVEQEKYDEVRNISGHEIKQEPGIALAKSRVVGKKSIVSQLIPKSEKPGKFHRSSSTLEAGKLSENEDLGSLTPAQETSSFNIEKSGQCEANPNSSISAQTPLTALDSLENFICNKMPGQSYAPASLPEMVPSQGVVHSQGVVPLQGVVYPQGVVALQGVASPPGTDEGLIQCQFNPSLTAIQTPLVVVGSPIQSLPGIAYRQMSLPIVPNPPYILSSTPANVRLNVPENSSPSNKESSSFFTLPGGAPKNIPSQGPSKPNANQSDKQSKRPCFRCEDCDVTFAKSESLDSHLKNYCIKRFKVLPSSTVTSRTLEKLSPFSVELHINGAINNASCEIQSCVSALNSAMINKRSALEASVKAASEAQCIIHHHNQIQKEKEIIFKELNDVISRENSLTSNTSEEEKCAIVDAKVQALSKAQTAFINEKFAESSVEQALSRQKVAIEAAVLATTQEQSAFLATMKAFKEQLNENKPAAMQSVSQKNGSVISDVGPIIDQQNIDLEDSNSTTEMLKKVTLNENCKEGISGGKDLVRLVCCPTTNQQGVTTDASSKLTENFHRILPGAAFNDELTEKPISSRQEKSPAEEAIELTSFQQRIATDASSKASEMLKQVPLDVVVPTLKEKQCEFSTFDTAQNNLYGNNVCVQQIPNLGSLFLNNNKNISFDRIATDASSKASEMLKKVPLDVVVPTSKEKQCEVSTFDTAQNNLYGNNVCVQQIPNLGSLALNNNKNISFDSSNKLKENMILSTKSIDECQKPSVYSTSCEKAAENILFQEVTDLNRTDLGKNKVIFYGVNTER